ncbi:fimbrial protein [Enterobacter huaxiensis]|uniref:fimbrial protein n=1 Tax=Enterobacter huaxiensis TaxID=2494702 RepID=UPI000E70E0A7|nr:fimbrial protein [Enterobacter huaxiensis]UNC50356.1 type 1 fimbrial protein [Enterobacter huaxiensis]
MDITQRLCCLFRHSFRAMSRVICGALALFTLQTQAYTCGFTDTFYENLSIPVVGPGMSTVGEDVPVGQVLYTGRFMGNARTTSYFCTVTVEDLETGQYPIAFHVYNKVDTITTPSGAPTLAGEKSVYPTNVPGIGATFTIIGSGTNTQFPATWENELEISYGTLTQGVGQFARVDVQLIKTGPIAPGTHQVLGSSLPTFQITSGSKKPDIIDHTFVTLSFTGAITMYTKTCQLTTSVVDVDLGTHNRSDFGGIGSATSWKNFDILLRDCPAFVGYGNHAYREATDVTTGTSTPNQVALGFNSVYGIVDNNPLLAKLESGPTAAEGIGIELSERNSTTSLSVDGSGTFNLQNLPTTDGSNFTIPLKARYVQYEAEVKAGIANGAAVFTITYN